MQDTASRRLAEVVRFKCSCGRVLRVNSAATGKPIRCRRCGSLLETSSMVRRDGVKAARKRVAGKARQSMFRKTFELPLRRSAAARSRLQLPSRRTLVAAIACVVIGLLVVSISTTAKTAFAYGLVGIGYCSVLAGTLWMLTAAFQEEFVCGVLMLIFFPIYVFYYAVTRWESAKWGVALGCGGTILRLFGLWLLGTPLGGPG